MFLRLDVSYKKRVYKLVAWAECDKSNNYVNYITYFYK